MNYFFLSLYFNGIANNDSDSLYRAISVASGDFFMACPILKFAKLYSNSQNRVFQYYLTQKPSDVSLSLFTYPDWVNTASHRMDLIYLFGNPFLYPNNFTDYDRKISGIMIDAFSYFAYHG